MKSTTSKNKHFHLPRAILFSFLSALSFSIMAVFVKLAAPHTTNSMTILFRFGISFLYILIILGIRRLQHKEISLKTLFPTVLQKLQQIPMFFPYASSLSAYLQFLNHSSHIFLHELLN